VRVGFNIPNFRCSPKIRPYLEKVFEGEYDVPISLERPVIIDIGANSGAFAIWAAHRWPISMIHSYEPQEEIFDEFFQNIVSSCLTRVIRPHNWGIGNPGMRPFYHGVNNSGEATLYPNPTSSDLGYHIEVRSPLSLPHANIIKIDAEGVELEIMEPLIRDGRSFDAILLEYHSAGDRVRLDQLLVEDYIMWGIEVAGIGRGTVRYLNRKYFV